MVKMNIKTLVNSPMSYKHHFIHLNKFLAKKRNDLQRVLLAKLFDCFEEVGVFDTRQGDSGKQVANDAVKQRDVVCEKLGQIDVNNRAKHLHQSVSQSVISM